MGARILGVLLTGRRADSGAQSLDGHAMEAVWVREETVSSLAGRGGYGQGSRKNRRDRPTQTTPRRSPRQLAASWILGDMSTTHIPRGPRNEMRIPKRCLACPWGAPNLGQLALLDATKSRARGRAGGTQARREGGIKRGQAGRDEVDAVAVFQIMQRLRGRHGGEAVLHVSVSCQLSCRFLGFEGMEQAAL